MIQVERIDYAKPLYWVVDDQHCVATFSLAIAALIAGLVVLHRVNRS